MVSALDQDIRQDALLSTLLIAPALDDERSWFDTCNPPTIHRD